MSLLKRFAPRAFRYSSHLLGREGCLRTLTNSRLRQSSVEAQQAPDGLSDALKHAIPQILSVLPAEWRGTTFNNSNLLGREGFAKNLQDLILRKFATGEKISKDELVEVGYAEDYLRVATNISTTLEVALAQEKGLDVSQVFTFASEALPIFAVCIVSKLPVKLYLGNAEAPFTKQQQDLLQLLGVKLECYPSFRIQPPQPSEVVLSLESALSKNSKVDGIIAPNVLYVMNPEKINPDDILVIRKRMSTPVTTPMAEGMLQQMAGMHVTANVWGPAVRLVTQFHEHLQKLCGTPTDKSASPVVTTVGLSALCALWVALIARGGADILMCSTAYGGSCQMTGIFDKIDAKFRKHDFHIQGTGRSIVPSIQKELDRLVNDKASLLPMTVVFLEIPTNPDMKVPDMPDLAALCMDYKSRSGRDVMLLVDSTFAPGSKMMQKMQKLAPDLNVMCFISLSKSVSRGLTTAGALVANHRHETKELLQRVAETCEMLDTVAKPDQMMRLVEHHKEVEDRCKKAYQVAETVGDSLRGAVLKATGHDMPLAFVTPEQGAMGFTTSTFSFNLPPPAGASEEVKEELAQRFVDLLCRHPEIFKPCVSFGQDNGLVYCTVPATSTQGAVKAEDKAKQAVGGVQLARLSFPPTCDVEAVLRIVSESVAEVYR